MMTNEKILSRLSSRYNSSKQQQGGEASFRVLYYGGGGGSVPFLWESQPGTPKHPLGDGPLPPLTPPPQHHSLIANPSFKKKHSKIFNSFFSNSKKSASPPSEKARLSAIRFDLEEDECGEGRVSTLCFRSKGYPIKGVNVKKVVKSIAARRHF